MYFQDLDNGYISALERENKRFVSKIFKTSDGGDTWVLIHQIPEMILNLELVDGTLYGTGNNVIIKDVQNKENWEYCFQDTSKKVGQIRDLEINNANKGYAVSFNGYVIGFTENTPETTRITKNRIRSLISVDDDQWIAVGDKNKEDGNLFISIDNGETWTATEQDFPDIHRIGKSNKKLWIVGKEGLVMSQKNREE
nr:hypothetical protein [Bacteroidota bacterium]